MNAWVYEFTILQLEQRQREREGGGPHYNELDTDSSPNSKVNHY